MLALYDEHFRNLSSPLVKMQPDFVVDIQNAASMLFRLERQGVDVGHRWNEIADKAEARIGDCLSAFTLPHWMMALAAAGRDDAARRMLDGMRDFAGGGASTARDGRPHRAADVEAALAHRRGEYNTGARSDAAGDRRHAAARRQPRPARRAQAIVPGLRRTGGARR